MSEGPALEFEVVGYGHGVGMCQYGADGMGKAGKDFREILTYYYRGISVEPLHNSPRNGHLRY